MLIRVTVRERVRRNEADSSTTAGNIICIFAVRFFENFATSQAIASHLVGMRKVRTAQSNAPVKSRLSLSLSSGQEIVPQKITTPQGEKVKM